MPNASLGVTDYPLMGVVKVTRTVFLTFCPSHIFLIVDAMHFKFRVLLDTDEY